MFEHSLSPEDLRQLRKILGAGLKPAIFAFYT
ncbi:MAG: hypothetical protein HW419_1304, partial [Deltaproteobacteria bacterium]|nr:hypothetical protein [Deltaproteobacteria bacterium]